MTTRLQKLSRATATIAFVAALSLTGFASPSAAASNDGIANLEFWWTTYGVDAAHAAGLTGAGVKVAIIEKQINPDLPVFQGRNLRVSDVPVCKDRPEVTTTVADGGSLHGSTMAALLIGNGTNGIRGIAPDADLTFYGYGPDSATRYCQADTSDGLSAFGYAVKLATDDGAKIIYTSVGQAAEKNDGPAIAYAMAKGAVVIASTSNPGQLFTDKTTDLGAMDGVVAATAINNKGELQQDDNGAPYVIPQTTVVAGGIDMPSVGVLGDWNQPSSASGSSYAPPLVAGMLALSAQQHPDSTGNQLVQAMIATTNGQVHTAARADDGLGYGAAWLSTLLTVDPTTYPDETPLTGKRVGAPTTEQIETAKAEGFMPIEKKRSFDEYGSSEPANTGGLAALVPWIVGGVGLLVVVAIGVTIIIIVISRRRSAEVGGRS